MIFEIQLVAEIIPVFPEPHFLVNLLFYQKMSLLYSQMLDTGHIHLSQVILGWMRLSLWFFILKSVGFTQVQNMKFF